MNWFLEHPWPPAIALTALAAVMRLVGRRNRRPVLSYVALAVMVPAGGVIVLSYSLTTPREAVRQHTRELVQATLPVESDPSGASDPSASGQPSGQGSNSPRTQPLDRQALDRLLAANATLRGPEGQVWVEAGRIPDRLISLVKRNPLADHRITTLNVELAGDNQAIASLRVRTSFAGRVQGPQFTTWRITWQRNDSDAQPRWQVTSVQWRKWMNRPPPRL